MFDTYWRFAEAKQRIYLARPRGVPSPWTTDPILSRHRFTNCYRAAGWMSQDLIRDVVYGGDQTWDEVFFRTVLFKLFNRTSTWRRLCATIGVPTWHGYRFEDLDRVLTAAFTAGERLYSAAYVIPPPRRGEGRKHRNHLRLIEAMMAASAPARIRDAGGMRQAFEILRSFPTFGDFLAYQLVIDLNYASALDFDEMEFMVPGPEPATGSENAPISPLAISGRTSSGTSPTRRKSISHGWGCRSPPWEAAAFSSSTASTCFARSTSTPASRTRTLPVAAGGSASSRPTAMTLTS